MTREELICLAEDINEWLESMSKKYGLDDVFKILDKLIESEDTK